MFLLGQNNQKNIDGLIQSIYNLKENINQTSFLIGANSDVSSDSPIAVDGNFDSKTRLDKIRATEFTLQKKIDFKMQFRLSEPKKYERVFENGFKKDTQSFEEGVNEISRLFKELKEPGLLFENYREKISRIEEICAQGEFNGVLSYEVSPKCIYNIANSLKDLLIMHKSLGGTAPLKENIAQLDSILKKYRCIKNTERHAGKLSPESAAMLFSEYSEITGGIISRKRSNYGTIIAGLVIAGAAIYALSNITNSDLVQTTRYRVSVQKSYAYCVVSVDKGQTFEEAVQKYLVIEKGRVNEAAKVVRAVQINENPVLPQHWALVLPANNSIVDFVRKGTASKACRIAIPQTPEFIKKYGHIPTGRKGAEHYTTTIDQIGTMQYQMRF